MTMEGMSGEMLPYVVRLLSAMILGGVIGLEREFHGRPAGLRTHIMVCLGAAMLMLIPERLSPALFRVTDPGRIAAGVITGIGFLGAGAIIRVGDLVRGLTTAACIWFTAAMGVLAGSGLIGLALISAVLGLMVLVVFDRMEQWIPASLYRRIRVRVDHDHWKETETACEALFTLHRIRLQETFHHWNRTEQVEMVFQIRTRNNRQSGTLVAAIGRMQGVSDVDWQ